MNKRKFKTNSNTALDFTYSNLLTLDAAAGKAMKRYGIKRKKGRTANLLTWLMDTSILLNVS